MNTPLMNAKETIRAYVDESSWSDWGEDEICRLMLIDFIDEKNFKEKINLSIKAIEEIIKYNHKKEIPQTLCNLYKIESNIYNLFPGARDHVVHSLNTYLLGHWLRRKLNLTIEDFNFQWMLAALFHDIGYPLQISAKLISDLVVEPMTKLRGQLKNQNREQYKIRIGFPSFHNLSRGRDGQQTVERKAFKLIQKCFEDWSLDIKAAKIYKGMTRTGAVNHGVASALMLLSYIDMYYQEANPNREETLQENKGNYSIMWGQRVFLESVVPPCAAIFLHSVRGEEFVTNKINKNDAPLAYLLRLADALQDWGRPCGANNEGYASENYQLGFENGKIQYYCPNDHGRDSYLNREKTAREDLAALDFSEVVNIVGTNVGQSQGNVFEGGIQ